MWVRGLKPDKVAEFKLVLPSHPMWVRGLKPTRDYSFLQTKVAPYVGAWIETLIGGKISSGISVAPYVGAWIETPQQHGDEASGQSHPMWVRGLKHIRECHE